MDPVLKVFSVTPPEVTVEEFEMSGSDWSDKTPLLLVLSLVEALLVLEPVEEVLALVTVAELVELVKLVEEEAESNGVVVVVTRSIGLTSITK